MPDKAIPKLVLPEPAVGPAPGVKPSRCDLFDVMQHLGYQKRILRPDQSLPVVGQQDLATEQESQAFSRSFKHLQDHRVFESREALKRRSKVDGDEKDSVRETQPVNV